ncbi:DUF4145 domain-containing protein [uncultured Marinobacter sp.]|uniref:DUF4145 domain-containing protein n=1 Tax=uncultured Marinobacter sp. TaxID=187379 RepID=UPI0030DA7AEF
MREIDKSHALRWTDIERTKFQAPQSLDIECPDSECRRSLVNVKLGWRRQNSFAWSQVRCAGCRTVSTIFFMDSPEAKDPGDDTHVYVYPAPVLGTQLERGLEDISPGFVEIYAQVQEAEALGLDSLVGVGYRKALEFLIKDYLISKNPDDEHKISRMLLAQCIRKYVTDPNIKDCADRAVWLGNDEAHYVRKWSDRDIEDLKTLLKLTRYWLSSEFLTAEYRERMQRQTKE